MSKKPDLNKQLVMIRKASLAVYVLLAVAAVALMNGASQQIRWFYQTRDTLASQNSTVFAEASHLLLDLQYRVALTVVLLVAVVGGLLVVTKYKKSYETAVEHKLVPWRWICYAIAGALMMETVGLVNGVQDIAVLKLLGGAVVVAALACGLAERDNKVSRTPTWKMFIVGVISGVLPWTLIGSILLGTALFGDANLPWYVYALSGVTLVGFVATGANQWQAIKKRVDYRQTERNYMLADLVMTVAFAAVLIGAFHR